MSCLIRISTVCHSVIDFCLKPLFTSMDVMDVSKFRDRKVHFRNSGERVNLFIPKTRIDTSDASAIDP